MKLSLQFNSETTSHDASQHSSRTALVLAVAGAAGNAWELGLIAGLSAAGVDVTDADLPATGRNGGYETRMPIWQPDAGGYWCCHHSAADHGIHWSGAWISQPKSTNCAQGKQGRVPLSGCRRG